LQKSVVRQLLAGGVIAVGVGGAALLRGLFSAPEGVARPPSTSESFPAPPPATSTARPVERAEPPSMPAPGPTAATLPASSAVAPDALADERALMSRLRDVQASDPEAAVALARAGNQRFPRSEDAPERTSILIHALSRLGRVSEARGEAEDMVNDYADSDWVKEVERFTGAHRHRSVRALDDGGIEFY
jgi:hypothetical protein